MGRWLLLLGVLAVVPLALLAAFASWQSQQLQHLRALEQVAGLSGLAAESAEGYALQTRTMLAEVASEEAVQRQDAAATRETLADHLGAYAAIYADITAARADGTVYADPLAAPEASRPSIAREPYFQEAMQTGEVAIQSVVQGEEVRLVFCRPVFDAAGQPVGTVETASNPIEVRTLASPVPLPEGASLALVGPQRTIVLHSDDPAHEAGRALLMSEESLAADGPDGAHEGQFLGQTALISASAVADTPWRVLVAVPAREALAGWQATLWGLAAALAVSLGAALFLGVRSASVGERGWQRQDFLRSLVDSASVGVAVVEGPDNRLEFANPVYQRFLGGAPESAAGRPLRDLLPAETAEAAEGYIAEAYRTGSPARVREVAVETGEPPHTSYWDVDYLPLHREEGRPPAMLMLAIPVTDRVRARREVEALAAQAEERAAQLQAVLGAISDAVLVYDINGNLTFINDAAARQVGIEATPEAVQRLSSAMQAMELYWPDGRPIVDGDRQLPRALGGEVILGEEFMYRPPTGGPLRWARASAGPVRNHEGQITGAVVMASDITDQKEAQAERERLLAEVQAARENLRTILDRLPDWVVVLDTSLRVTLANAVARRDAARGAVGMTAAELRRVHELTDAEGHPFPSRQTPAQRALRGEVVTGVEGCVRLPDGSTVNVLESAAPLYDSEGRLYGVAVVVTDITARKQVEAERERLLAEVQTAHENLRTILDRLPDGVLVVDAAQRVVMGNETTRAYVGQDVVGMTLAQLRDVYGFVMPDGRPFPPGQAPIDRALRGETVAGIEARVLRLNGYAADALESAAPLRDAEGRITGAVVALTDITVRREAERERERLLAEIQRARASLYTIIDRLPDWVLVFDTHQRVLMNNEAIRRYAGYDVAGLTVDELRRIYEFAQVDGRPFPAGQSPLDRALRGEAIANVEVTVRLPNGSVAYALESVAPLYEPEGRLYGAVAVLANITTRKQAEAERERLLAEVEEGRRNLQTMLHWLPAGVVAVGQDLRVAFTNEIIQQFLGRDLAGTPVSDVLREYGITTPDGQPFLVDEQSPLLRTLGGEPLANLEALAHLPDGRRVNVLASLAPMRGPDGAITGAVIATLDVTAERQAQAERERLLAQVEKGRRELQTIIDQLPDTVIVADASGRVSLSNSTARQYAGREIVGMTLPELHEQYDFRRPDGKRFPEQETPLERGLRGEVVTGVEGSVKLPDGRRYDVLKSAAPVLGPDGSVRETAAVLVDVTGLKELDRAKDQFISVAAHELRAPLTALKGHTQILLRRAERAGWAEGDRRSLHAIDDQVDRLDELIDRLLNVSRIRLGRLQLSREPTDVVALARQVADELQITTDRHRITVQSEVPELVGNWDPAALRQVLTNLVGNAIRYADPGPIDVRLRPEDGWAMVSVTDYGPGIPPERQARIFEAFRRGAAEEYRKAGGLGLGLYISRGIVEAHGGKIWVQSQVGVGTTFTFSLPLNSRAR